MPSKNFLTPFALLVLALTAQGAYAQGEDARYEIVEVEGREGQVEIEVPDAPVYEITAPQYYDPYYAPRPQRMRRYRVPYHEGMAIPEGGYVVTKRRMGLAIPGAVLFGVPYISTLAVWTSEPWIDRERVSATVLIPGIGPFIALAKIDPGDYDYPQGLRVGLAFDGLFQIAGITMLSFGLIGKKYLIYYADVRDRTVAFQLSPIVSPYSTGASLGVRF